MAAIGKAGMRGAPLLIGLDLGTSAMKGVVLDANGKDIAVGEKTTTLSRPAAGRVEQDAERLYRDVCEILRELSDAAPGPIAAVAMAAASGNTLLTDAAGVPLTPIINWMDQRAVASLPEALAPLEPEAVRQVVGWPCIDTFPLAHLAWWREHEAALYRRAERYVMNTDWLLFRMTGKWAMDHSTATTFHLQNQVSGAYHTPFLNLLDIREAQLSPLVRSGTAVGTLTEQALHDTGLDPETVVVAGCFDHPAAARAMNVIEPGQLLLSCGTSWVGFFPVADRQQIIDAGLLCDPFLSGSDGPWGAIFSVPQIGTTIDWYIAHVIAPGEPDPMEVFNASAAEADAGAGGLTIDLQRPPQPIDAERSAVSRAVMEGAARLLHENLQRLASRGMTFTKAVMVGGPARSPVWPTIVADETGLEIVTGTSHAGAHGAAQLAAMGINMQPQPPETPS